MKRKGWYYDVSSDEYRIFLTQGRHAVVDQHLVLWLAQWNWCAAMSRKDGKISWYAKRSGYNPLIGPARTTISMHREIAGFVGMDLSAQIDHQDQDQLNNRAANLRSATVCQNTRNRSMFLNNTSGFKGVSYAKDHGGRWLAQITLDRRKRNLGYFNTPQEAYVAYCSAAERLHGEFARID